MSRISGFDPTHLRPSVCQHLLVSALLLLCISTAAAQTNSPLAKTTGPTDQDIPLVVSDPGTGEISKKAVNLKWEAVPPGVVSGDALEFRFEGDSKEGGFDSFRAQLWISALASSNAWQEPWLNARWTVKNIPPGDASGCGAALGIGLIAVSSNTTYPKDTVVIGSVNPDGSIGLVSDLARRVEIAAKAGMKRVIIPALQQNDSMGSPGKPVDIEALARRLGMDCVAVGTLTEATQLVLQKKLPDPPVLEGAPKYSDTLKNYFDERCRAELSVIEAGRKSWPKLKALPPGVSLSERLLWERIYKAYDLSMEAYRKGQVYVALERFHFLNGLLKAASALRTQEKNFSYVNSDTQANILRKRINERMINPSIDKDELQSGLVLAQESYWLSGLTARIEGAQNFARQAFGPRTEATAQQRDLAQEIFVTAVAQVSDELGDSGFYTQVYKMGNQEPVPVFGRAAIWLPQLIPAQLGAAEFFSLGLRTRAAELRDSLLFDFRLCSYVRVLNDVKKTWEGREEAKRREELAAQPRVILTASQMGFVPGKAYEPPKAPAPPPAPISISDTARCLIWVNEYCEVSVLEQKYARLGGSFQPEIMEWQIENKAALESMLQQAEAGAKRGVVFAQRVGVDTAILAMIYESASNLRQNPDSNLQLEALRQYWRCALLGSMCWQLGFLPKSDAAPAAAVAVAAAPDEKGKNKNKGKETSGAKPATEEPAAAPVPEPAVPAVEAPAPIPEAPAPRAEAVAPAIPVEAPQPETPKAEEVKPSEAAPAMPAEPPTAPAAPPEPVIEEEAPPTEVRVRAAQPVDSVVEDMAPAAVPVKPEDRQPAPEPAPTP